jgi:hypothetical protein
MNPQHNCGGGKTTLLITPSVLRVDIDFPDKNSHQKPTCAMDHIKFNIIHWLTYDWIEDVASPLQPWPALLARPYWQKH